MYIGSSLKDVQEVIASGRNMLERSGITQSSALHRAVDGKFYEPGVVTALVQAGLDPNAREVNKRTPLHYARHPEAIAELLANGADPNLGDVNGQTALQINLSKEKSICRMERVHALLNGGADINHADNNGVTPLLSALEARRPSEFIELLIERGADINVQDVDGQGVLCWSTAEGDVENTKLLISLGADINSVSRSGMSVLNYCAQSGQLECADVLLDAGADPRIANSYGITPLHNLASSGRRAVGGIDVNELVHNMMKAGADINAQDVDGRTALHAAARHLCMETVEALIGHGASSTIVNKQGKTALEIANRSSEQTKQGKSTADVANDYKVLSVIEAATQKAALQEALHIQRDEPQTASRWRRM